MVPSIWSECFVEYEPERALEVISSCGFRCVEFGGSSHFEAIDQDENPLSRAKEIRQVADRVGVVIDQMHGPFVNPLKEDQRTRCKEMVCRALEYASLLGAKWVVFHSATVGADDASSLTEKEMVEINVEFFSELIPFAEKTGTGIAIENMFDYPQSTRSRFSSRPGDLLTLVERLDSDCVGICWDTGHANVQGLEQSAALKRLSTYLRAIHIADNDGTGDQHSVPFCGTRGNQNMCDWSGIVSTLKNIGFNGPFNLEIPGATDKIPLKLRPDFIEYAYKLCKYFCE